MPTLTPSAPCSTSARAASPVAILPPITCTCGKFCLTQRTRSSTPWLWPCAVSTTITSTPALTSSSTRSSLSGPTPTAAPTRSWPWSSLLASGFSTAFWMSFTVIRPRSSKAWLTTSTRSRRWRFIRRLASSSGAPSATVTSFSRGVILARTGASSSSSKRRSRLVMMPTTVLPSSTGKPEMPCCCDSAITSRIFTSGEMVIGSRSTPDS
ncbi:hypothetical protein D9M68_685850 [compost metagenome]